MAESFVNVTEGAGKKLHTWSRSVSGNTVEDEFTIPGEYPLPTYVVLAEAVSIATATSHLLQLMAGASLNVRIRRIWFEQITSATTAGQIRVEVLRLTSAGTGGTAVTARPLDSADAAAGASGMTLPTVKGTEGVLLFAKTIALRQAFSATSTQMDDIWEWDQTPNAKPLIIPAGAANGVVLKGGGNAGATADMWVEFVETAFAG